MDSLPRFMVSMLWYIAAALVALHCARSEQRMFLWDSVGFDVSMTLAVITALLCFSLRRYSLEAIASAGIARRASVATSPLSFASRLLTEAKPIVSEADAFARALKKKRRPPPPSGVADVLIGGGDQHKFTVAIERIREHFPESYEFHTDWDIRRFVVESAKAQNGVVDYSNLMRAYESYVNVYRRYLFVSPLPLARRIEGWPVDDIFKDLPPRRSSRLTECLQLYEAHFLECAVINRDKLGRPITWMRGMKYFRAMECLAQRGKMIPMWIKWAFQSASAEATMRLCEHQWDRSGVPVRGALQVMDLGGISLRTLIWFARSDSKFETRFSNAFFPGIVDKVVVVNAPRGVGMLWAIVKPFLPSSIRDKVEIAGSTTSHLLGLIDADQLPTCYGGSYPFSWPALPREGDDSEAEMALLEVVRRKWPSDPASAGYACVNTIIANDERFV